MWECSITFVGLLSFRTGCIQFQIGHFGHLHGRIVFIFVVRTNLRYASYCSQRGISIDSSEEKKTHRHASQASYTKSHWERANHPFYSIFMNDIIRIKLPFNQQMLIFIFWQTPTTFSIGVWMQIVPAIQKIKKPSYDTKESLLEYHYSEIRGKFVYLIACGDQQL